MRYKLTITILLVSMLIIITACDTNKALSDNDANNTAQELIYYEENNVSFYYPPSLSEGISYQTVAASTGYGWTDYPEHKLILFDNYVISDSVPYDRAYIMLTPLEEFYLLCHWAEGDINKLEFIIAKKEIPENIGEPHYLPSANAGQLFIVNVEFFESKTSSGLRYLTQFYQTLSPVTNEVLLYIYQGITCDQKYYFTALFPVNHSELPLDYEDYLESSGTDMTDGDSWMEVYDDYMNLTVQMLDEAAAEDFEPSLLLLDEIIKSFQIE